MSLVEVSKGVFAFIERDDSMKEGWGANQGFVATEEGVVVIDTGFTRARALALRRAIRDSSPAPVRLVINTHDHSDHVFGNSVFVGEGPLFLSHSWCRKRVVQMGRRRLEGYRKVRGMRREFRGLNIVRPQAVFRETLELAVGSTEFVLIHPAWAHTRGDTMVYLPQQRVLFAGDVVWKDYHPNLEDADMAGWISALADVSRMDTKVIVPGHGPVAGSESPLELAAYLKRFDRTLREAAERGAGLEEAVAEMNPPHSDGWKLKMIIRRNLGIIYRRYVKDAEREGKR